MAEAQEPMHNAWGAWKRWTVPAVLGILCFVLGAILVWQWQQPPAVENAPPQEDWEFVVAGLVDTNGRMRQEIEALQAQLAGYEDAEQGGTVLQLLVHEVNTLRVMNGLVEVSGPGVEVTIRGAISVLDLQDLINELRNAGAEALALDGQRLVTWSAIGTDGAAVTVDSHPARPPHHLLAIGDPAALEAALTRPGGLVSLLRQAEAGPAIVVERRQKLIVPVYGQEPRLVLAKPAQ